MPGDKIRILFVAASPDDRDRLRSDREFREMEAALAKSPGRDEVDLEPALAVRASDLIGEMNRFRPQVLHFSGHGTEQGIYLEGEGGESALASAEAVTRLFGQFRDTLQLVILNACGTEDQARALTAQIPCVIGVSGEVEDEAAIRFAGGLHHALASGHNLADAFEQACLAIGGLAGIPGTPPYRFHTGAGVVANERRLLEWPRPGRGGTEAKAYRMVVERARNELPRAAAYKKVHDLLQEIEGVFRPLRAQIQEGDRWRPAEQIIWRSVRASCSRMSAHLAELRDLLPETPFAADAQSLAEDLASLAEQLRIGPVPPDPETLGDGLDHLEFVLGRQLPVMDKGLMESIDHLGLGQLAEVAAAVRGEESLPGRPVSPTIAELETLTRQIALLRTAHHELQALDDELRAEETRVRLHPRKTLQQWNQRLSRRLDRFPANLAGMPGIADLRQRWIEVDAVAAAPDDLGNFRETFLDLRDEVLRLFNRVDADLRKGVDALREAGHALNELLNALN